MYELESGMFAKLFVVKCELSVSISFICGLPFSKDHPTLHPQTVCGGYIYPIRVRSDRNSSVSVIQKPFK